MSDKRDAERRDGEHRTAGTNARPLDETIAQTGGGLPDDTSEQVEVQPEEMKRMGDQIRPR
ncbi:hypothetical protein GCM10011390_09470 [Aureimonas endophytica]|uniref:Uncharacterized protein n=1 Tax=Aureimonas endophytica TaxID=2027858 RepID=A0A916ZEV6_9HYPH|nr:hypothetical protein [Aureimonas endophytica]GGD92851.1 hypothetical protein GCM10011390_09470 [Aureimonas endophytica]